ncbi:MAG: hypothetical protein ACOYMN_04650 [Roseimicrobium sp.]
MTQFIAQRPWLFIVAAFAILISVWTGFIYVAVTNGPVIVPLEATTASIHAGH